MCVYIYINTLLAEDHLDMPLAKLIVAMQADADLWQDAEIPAVVTYLRGATGLAVPPELRCLLGMV